MKVRSIVKRLWGITGLVFLFCFVSFFVYDHVVNEPKAALIQQELEQEFKSIESLPQARACNYRASHKTQQALVGDSYATKLSFAEIRAHYDAELSNRGWRFQGEKPMQDWGRDFGGKSVRYCKGNYTATLQYAGENADNGWDYGLDLSWGLGSLYERWKGTLCQ